MSTSTPTTSAPASAGVRAFLAALRAADLFAPMQLARAEAAVPADAASPADAAGALVASGFLTQFQAERLLAGKTDGFHLGPYVILEQVGRGTVGRVYKARHRTMNRPVAVKIVAAELTRTATDRQAFQKEVRTAAQLNHPNIVTAYDANELAERFYLVVEFVDGPDLEALVAERGPLSAAEACELVRQAAAGLAHAHGQGILHRDIKPTNLLVARPSKTVADPQVKIADFGIARLSPSRSADYVAPESACDPAAADHRADLYSLGAVLYFLLAGRPPFPGGTPAEKLLRHLREEPARLESLRPDVPPTVAALVHQLLAKHPDNRPASAAEVVARLAATAGADVVCVQLPAADAGAYSFVAGPLSNTYPPSPARPLPGAYPLAAPSPWEQITEETQAESHTLGDEPEPLRATRRTPGLSGWMTTAFASGMMLLCLLAVGLVVKVMGK
jgi:serine/threonine protein kinase